MPDASTDTTKAGAEESKLPGSKVLVVDDNEQNLELLVAYLDGLECTVTTAGDGVAALEQVVQLQRVPSGGMSTLPENLISLINLLMLSPLAETGQLPVQTPHCMHSRSSYSSMKLWALFSIPSTS